MESYEGYRRESDFLNYTFDVSNVYPIQSENISDFIENISILEDARSEIEIRNLFECWNYFSNLRKTLHCSILTRGLIEHGHNIMMSTLIDNAGVFSNCDRQSSCPITGNKIIYPTPEFICERFDTLIDYTNQLSLHLENEIKKHGLTDSVVRRCVKFLAWFFISFIRLHPFSDGNGRLAHIILGYLQLLILRTPTALFSKLKDSSLNRVDYLKAIAETHNQHILHACENHWCFSSKPYSLATIILRRIPSGNMRKI
jgi:hypothetical protein